MSTYRTYTHWLVDSGSNILIRTTATKNPDPSNRDHVCSDGVLSYYALTEVTMANDGSEEIHKDDEVRRLIV